MFCWNCLRSTMGESSKKESEVVSTTNLKLRHFKNPFDEYTDGTIILDSDNALLERYEKKLLGNIKQLNALFLQKVTDDGNDYSIYTGSSGYALLYLQLYNKNLKKKEDYLQKACFWLDYSLEKLKNKRFSFLCGDSGPLALAALLHRIRDDKEKSKYFISRLKKMCDEVCQKHDIPDENLYGRCGYLSALLFIRSQLGRKAIKPDYINKVVESILMSGKMLSKLSEQNIPLMYKWHDKKYLGAAHGLAGIYYILLQVDEPEVQEQVQELVRPCIDFLLDQRYPTGNGPSSIHSKNGDCLVQWCHGAPGWVQLFALSYKIFKDDRYLEAAVQCGTVVWQRGLLTKGYGLCHGAAGNAYTFLTLFQLTNDQKYLYYAYKFAEWCCDYGRHDVGTPDRPFSMFEGLAGTIYFLADMLDPYTAAFPGYDFEKKISPDS